MPRFTSHGEVCYEPTSRGRLFHPFWGDYETYWPGEAKPDMTRQTCGTCGQNQGQAAPALPAWSSFDAWFDAVKAHPSDFHEHMETLRELARKSDVCAELSMWLKPALLSMAAAKPKKLLSVCPGGGKGEWGAITHLFAKESPSSIFEGVRADPLQAEPVACDLLFIDTLHQAGRLYQELSRWAPLCRHYVVVHCTETFGDKGDDGGAGVMHAVRQWVRENKQWTVIKSYKNNHGLIVMSCKSEDKKPLPAKWRQVLNFGKAMTKHAINGGRYLPLPLVEERVKECLTCESNNDQRCAECGCPLIQVPDDFPVRAGQPGKVFFGTEACPLGKWAAQPGAGVDMTAEEVKAMMGTLATAETD